MGVFQVSAHGLAMSSRLGNVSNTLNIAPIKPLPLTVGGGDCDDGHDLLGMDEPSYMQRKKMVDVP